MARRILRERTRRRCKTSRTAFIGWSRRLHCTSTLGTETASTDQFLGTLGFVGAAVERHRGKDSGDGDATAGTDCTEDQGAAGTSDGEAVSAGIDFWRQAARAGTTMTAAEGPSVDARRAAQKGSTEGRQQRLQHRRLRQRHCAGSAGLPSRWQGRGLVQLAAWLLKVLMDEVLWQSFHGFRMTGMVCNAGICDSTCMHGAVYGVGCRLGCCMQAWLLDAVSCGALWHYGPGGALLCMGHCGQLHL